MAHKAKAKVKAKAKPKRARDKGKASAAKARSGKPAESRRRAKPSAVPDLAALRRTLVEMLRGGVAHLTFDNAVNDLPSELRGLKPEGFPHSPWQLLEHLRLAQRDILDFSRNPKYAPLEFPAGYWPQTQAPPDDAAWEASARSFHADLAAMEALVNLPATDLLAPIPHGEGQTIAREAILLAAHNGYHLGQMVLVRRLLGAWKE